MRGQQVACITYTEIAAKEIWEDVGNTPLIHVSTIHSFLWAIVHPFQKDIKKWVYGRIAEKRLEKEEKIAKTSTRAATKVKLGKEIERLDKQKDAVHTVPYFNYGTGSNYEKGILGHDDIIKLTLACLNSSDTFRKIVGQKYPYIFVDESQDTFSNVVEALSLVRETVGDKFCLGFFGDPMQKIYATGVGELPVDRGWKVIKKPENFRCATEVLDLINNIRRSGDGLEQTPGNRNIGSAQIFVLPVGTEEQRTDLLAKVRETCANKLSDPQWNVDEKVKILVIVHRMAAKRLNFPTLYAAMNDQAPASFSDGFMDGTSWPMSVFLKFVLPIVEAHRNRQNSTVMHMLRAHSPKLTGSLVKGAEVRKALEELRVGINQLVMQLHEGSTSTVLDVLKTLHDEKIAILDERLLKHMEANSSVDNENENEEDEEDAELKESSAIQRFFAVPVVDFWGYLKYYSQQSPFATQQGVKGAQFDRVVTVLDDNEGKHSQFSYDKYFGLTELSANDKKNIEAGDDHVVSRTRRLFYVCCSRAQNDLVVIYFTSDVDQAVEKIKAMKIFRGDQIFTLVDLN